MKNFVKFWAIPTLCLVACGDAPEPVETDDFAYVGSRSGGDATVFNYYLDPFGQPLPGLTDEQLAQHNQGDFLFETSFVSSGNKTNPGLGPLFNENSCDHCHPKDGRADFPKNLNVPSGFFLRISSGNDPIHGPIAAPGFGGQLQQNAVNGFVPEVQFGVVYQPLVRTYADGTQITLQKPVYSITPLERPLPAKYELSPRIGMPVFGLGLLENIPEKAILAYADADDSDGDGISGRPNYVWDNVNRKTSLGRFGWKANTATLREQCAAAMVNDMGLTNPLFNMEERGELDKYKHGIEISVKQLDDITFYCQTLSVPARTNAKDPTVMKGEKLFTDLGCAKCHVPTMKTGKNVLPNLNEQTIHAFTDMLLHDMGDDLADEREDFLANGKEWKTRSLWGLGYTLAANGHERLLHDGRAKSIEEAILWHGGEAEDTRNKFMALPKGERQTLLTFLRSL